MNNVRSVNVEYMGATWMVTGTWLPEEPDSWDCPGNDAGFDDYQILHGTDSEGNDMDMWELLADIHIEKIRDLAEEKILEGGERDE